MFALSAGEGTEEVAGWIEGYLYKAEGDGEEGAEGEGEIKMTVGDEAVEEEGKTDEAGRTDAEGKEEEKGEAVNELVKKTEDVKLSS
jgi:hypothetical protein